MLLNCLVLVVTFETLELIPHFKRSSSARYRRSYSFLCCLGKLPSFDLFAMTGLPELVASGQTGSAIRKDRSAPDPFFNGYKFHKPLRDIALVASESEFRLFSAALSRQFRFVFLASMKQHKKNVGTIMSIVPQPSSGASFPNTMALVSDARRNAFELFYEVDGVERRVTFKADNADLTPGHTPWKRIILEVDGDVATLYVDCVKIGSRLLASQFYRNFNPDVTKMTLAAGYTSSNGHRYDSFKVSSVLSFAIRKVSARIRSSCKFCGMWKVFQ